MHPVPPMHGIENAAVRSSAHHQNPPLTSMNLPMRDNISPQMNGYRRRDIEAVLAVAFPRDPRKSGFSLYSNAPPGGRLIHPAFQAQKKLVVKNKALPERIICGDESYHREYNKKRSALPSKAQKRHGKDRDERLRSKLSLP